MPSQVTYCRICEAACGLLADVEGDRVVRLRPDRDHVVSRGFACAKGTRFSEVHRSHERLRHPMARRGDRLTRVGWDEALAEIGGELQRIRREHGPDAVAVYTGNPAAFNYAQNLCNLALIQGLGTKNLFNAGSLDCNNKFVVANRMLGSPASQPVPDLDRAAFALLIGTNPSVSQSSFVNAPRMVERLKAIVARGGRVIVVDPRRSETARSVGEHVPIVPDTDAALLLALLHVVFAEELTDREALDRYSAGAGELRRAVEDFTPELVAPLTRVPADTIRELARAFAAAGGAFCHVSTGVNQGTHGSIAYAAKIALELVTGNLDRAGGALMPLGALDVAGLLKRLGLDKEPEWQSRIGGFPTVMGALPTAILADEILTPGRGQVRALIVVAGNPLLSAPDGSRLEKALSSLELLVSVDLFVNDTGALASHVLPSSDWLERDDLPFAQFSLQPVPYVQWSDAVVPPPGECRHDWQILIDIARAAGVPLFGKRAIDLAFRAALRTLGFKRMLAPLLMPALGSRPLEVLRRHPHGLRVSREKPGDFLERRLGRRVELFPRDVYLGLPRLRAELSAAAVPDSLKLITKRERLGHNSWMHANPLLPGGAPRAHLAPSDAARLGIASGDRLRLSSESGSIEIVAEVDPDMIAGAIAVPHGYGHHAASGWQSAVERGGCNVNQLAASGPEAVDPLTGMCRFVGVPVRVRKIAQVVAAE